MSALQAPSSFAAVRPTGALVSKVDPIAHADRYLQITAAGRLEWVADPDAATPFPSMRDATRMAMRLPAGQRAFGIPAQHH